MIASSIRISIALPLLAGAGLADVRVVPSPNYPTIQAAVDAALDGDVVLVSQGTYAFFSITGKSVTVAARSSGVNINGLVRVQEIPAQGRVSLIGLSVNGNGKQALRLANCTGSVRVYGGTYRGTNYLPESLQLSHGVYATDCNDVAFSKATLIGGHGYFGDPTDNHDGGNGGPALLAINCRVALNECALTGGQGGSAEVDSGGSGGNGGEGAELRWPTSYLLASKSTFVGGKGGAGAKEHWTCPGHGGSGGNGGHGLLLQPVSGTGGPHADLMDISAGGGLGGAGGPGLCGSSGSTGSAGQPVVTVPGSTATLHPWLARSLEAPGPWRAGQQATLTFRGAPGDAVYLMRSQKTDFVRDLAKKGVFLLGGMAQLQHIGTIGASGVLTRTLNVPVAHPGFQGTTVQLQAWMDSPVDGLHLTGMAAVSILHPSY